MKKILYVTLVSCIGLTIIISCSDKDEEWESNILLSEDISISSSVLTMQLL